MLDSDLSLDEEFGGLEWVVGSKYEFMESDSEDESWVFEWIRLVYILNDVI